MLHMLPLLTIDKQAGLLTVNDLTSLLTLLTLTQTIYRSTNIRRIKLFREIKSENSQTNIISHNTD